MQCWRRSKACGHMTSALARDLYPWIRARIAITAAVLANGGRDIAIHGKRNGLYCASRVGMHTNGVLRGYVCCYHE